MKQTMNANSSRQSVIDKYVTTNVSFCNIELG
jgi:hypothetical protein